MVFVVGNSRSGTKTMAEIFSSAGNAVAFHEANAYPWLELEKEGYGGNSARKEVLRKVIKHLPPKWAVKAQEDGKIPIDSNHYISPVIPCIHYLMPKSRFIYLLRDPANIIRSWMNLVFPMNDKFLKKLVYEKHRWRPFPREVTDRFERLCLYWCRTNTKIADHLKKADHIVVRLEELGSEMERIWEWVGLEGNMSEAVEKASTRFNSRKPVLDPPFPKFEQWSGEQKAFYERTVMKSPLYSYITPKAD
jgi:hypothetical protein